MYLWSVAAAWRRRVLLHPDPKYQGKKLGAALMAVSAVSSLPK